MLRLRNCNRNALAAVGGVLALGGFALLPLYGDSLGTEKLGISPEGNGDFSPLGNDTAIRLPLVEDPFARPLPSDPAQPIAARAGTGPRKRSTIHVQAIVQGKPPLALVDDGVIRIVAVGDAIDGSRVSAITADHVVLADGRHLALGDQQR